MAGSSPDAPAYTVDLDPDRARELAEQGGFLLLLDLPVGTTLGIDHHIFATGPLFKGVKMLPPGPHFVYYSAASKEGGTVAATIGFFIFFEPRQVEVRKWDPADERLAHLSDTDEAERYAAAVRRFEFDANLGAYDLPRWRAWHRLSNYITKEVISSHGPIGGDISITPESALSASHPTTLAEQRMNEHIEKSRINLEAQNYNPAGKSHQDANLEPSPMDTEEARGADNKGGPSGRCFYTRVPRVVKKAGATAAELTALNMDKSVLLEEWLLKEYQGEEEALLGEFQFAFIAFLMGQSLEAFGQWKAILHLLLGCLEAPICTETCLFTKFLRVVYSQLSQSLQQGGDENTGGLLDEGFFQDDFFLKRLLQTFFSALSEARPIDGDLQREAEKLQRLLEGSLGWTFSADVSKNDEEDEYAPAVVDLG